MNSNTRQDGTQYPPKEGDQPQTIKEFEEAKERVQVGKGTLSDSYIISQWAWDHQPGGDQRR